jgi:flagellar hook-associated protein 1 FlgK
MSLSSFLSIARSALIAHRMAMDVTANNIANAQTPGYTRQRAELANQPPLWTAFTPIGRGVTVVSIERVRDTFFDASVRTQSGVLGRSTTLRDFLAPVEAALQEPTDDGVAAALDSVFEAFADLANDPAGRTTREQARAAASRLVDRLRGVDAQLRESEAGALERLRTEVDEINAMAAEVARLNADVLASKGASGASPDLADLRDRLVDRLSERFGLKVSIQSDGSLTVVAGNAVLVDRGTHVALEVRSLPGGTWGVAAQGGAGTIDPRGGTVGGLLELVNQTLPGLHGRLDTLVASVVSEFNAIHRAGTTLTGATGVDFFDPAGVTAGSMALSAAVAASTDAIAASATGAPGDGGAALRIAGLGRNAIAALGGSTLREYVVSIAVGLGVTAGAAARDAEAAAVVLDHLDAQRQGISGVSVEEEMARLIEQQQAYAAAARLLAIAEEMIDEVLRAV